MVTKLIQRLARWVLRDELVGMLQQRRADRCHMTTLANELRAAVNAMELVAAVEARALVVLDLPALAYAHDGARALLGLSYFRRYPSQDPKAFGIVDSFVRFGSFAALNPKSPLPCERAA